MMHGRLMIDDRCWMFVVMWWWAWALEATYLECRSTNPEYNFEVCLKSRISRRTSLKETAFTLEENAFKGKCVGRTMRWKEHALEGERIGKRTHWKENALEGEVQYTLQLGGPSQLQ